MEFPTSLILEIHYKFVFLDQKKKEKKNLRCENVPSWPRVQN